MVFSISPSVAERMIATRPGTPAPSAARATAPARPAATAPAAPFHQSLRGLGQELDRGERLVDRALRGGEAGMSPAQLIALQAGIYRYSEAVDLTVKLIDHAASAVRTTLQNPG